MKLSSLPPPTVPPAESAARPLRRASGPRLLSVSFHRFFQDTLLPPSPRLPPSSSVSSSAPSPSSFNHPLSTPCNSSRSPALDLLSFSPPPSPPLHLSFATPVPPLLFHLLPPPHLFPRSIALLLFHSPSSRLAGFRESVHYLTSSKTSQKAVSPGWASPTQPSCSSP